MRVLVLLLIAVLLAGCGERSEFLSSADHSGLLPGLRAAGGDGCSTTWVGPARGGDWSSADSWSSQQRPGPDDQACVGRDVELTISAGRESVGSVVIGGSLRMSGGTLEIVDTRTASIIGNLRLEAGSKLIGHGNLILPGQTVLAGGTLATHSMVQVGHRGGLSVPCGPYTPLGVCP